MIEMQTPAVSVVVPVYNAEKYLQKCIDSIRSQTLTSLEIILVNDGSTDSSGAIADRAAKQDARIKVIHQPNAHLSAARNAGLACAKGRYLLFVDSDDWIEPGMVHALYTKAQTEGMDVVISGLVVEYTKENRQVHIGSGCYRESIDGANLELFYQELVQRKLFNYACCKLYRTSLLTEHQIRFDVQPPFEDEPFNMQVFMVAKKLCVLPDVFYHYMRNDEMTIVSSYKADYLDAYKAKVAVYHSFFRSFAWDAGRVEAFLHKSTWQAYSVYMQSLYKPNARLGRKRRLRIIRKDIYGDLSLRQTVRQSAPTDAYQRIFRCLFLNCSPVVTDWVYLLLFFFRYRLAPVYSCFRKRSLK